LVGLKKIMTDLTLSQRLENLFVECVSDTGAFLARPSTVRSYVTNGKDREIVVTVYKRNVIKSR